jgi:hypothetical protein
MRRVALYGIGWIAAAAVAVLLAWQGVGLVGRNVTDTHPRALTADEAREALGEGSVPGEPSGSGPAATSPPGGSPSPGASHTSSTTSRPRATATTAPSSSPSTATSPSSTSPSGPATAPTTAGVVRTYNLVGGSAALRFEPGKVTVVWANPNPGFRADIDSRDGGGVRVRFDGDSHRSEVEAWWDGGPRDRTDEDGSSGGGSGPG